ncbi:AbrB/MazE/SpoVT family DNA-binding domain-containing protein [Kitasatospora sp. NPDC048540]|uniref:AbrB/MazE/SpoVT family DNA-binding domain-containing protein n=1 Tax=Kitasatospora sp. NPDC048540 TaxID=3155634 RepID=UPI00340A1DA0
MDNNTEAVARSTVGQRGRLMIPAALQRVAGIAEGTRVVLRVTTDGTITVETVWALALRLRSSVGRMLPPPGAVSVRWGGRPGRPDGVRPTDPLPRSSEPNWLEAAGYAEATGTGPLTVLTADAVLSWLAGADGTGPGGPLASALPHAVLPEQAVGQLVTHLVKAGARDQVDAVLGDLQLLGLQLAAPSDGHADLAHDTATALELVTDAARDGGELDFTDALCAAVALRLGLLLISAGNPPQPADQHRPGE